MIGKVGTDLEDYISEFMYNISDKISPSLLKLNITPNIITTIRFIALFIAIYIAHTKNNRKIIAIIIISFYFMDCLDGHFARKYNMITEFGDYYDHIVDILGIVLLVFYVLKYIKDQSLLIVFFFLLLTSFLHIGCEELLLQLNNDQRVMSKAMSVL